MKLLKKDDLLTHSAMMFLAMMVVHVCNLVYQMVVSRALQPEDYTLLMTFLGILAIVSRPLGALSTSMNHYVSLLKNREQAGDAARLLTKWILRVGGAGFILGFSILLFRSPISAYFHIDRLAPVTVTGLLLPSIFLLSILNGTGFGLQIFRSISLSLIIGALFRVGLGAFFVVVLFPACGWALLGHGAGLYVTCIFLFSAICLSLRGEKRSSNPLPSLRFYLLQSFFIHIAFAVLMNADIVLVKRYLPENETFAYAATIGRIAAFLPAAIVLAMFPKVVSSEGTSAEHHSLFVRSLMYTLICVAPVLAGCLIFPQLPLLIFLGIHQASDELILLTRLMSIAMGISALLNPVVMFLLAQRRFAEGASVIPFAVLYMIAVHFLHADAVQIANHVILFNGLGLLGCLSFIYWKWKRAGCEN